MSDTVRPTDQQAKEWGGLRVTPGSQSDARLPRPLSPRRFRVRNESLAEAFCKAGKRLGAADVPLAREDRYARPWARLFQNEPAYLYAEILSFKAGDAGFAFAEALEYEPTKALTLTRELSDQLTDWLRRIQLESPVPFSKQIDQLNKERNLSGLLADMYGKGPAELTRIAKKHPSVLAASAQAGPLAEARALRDRLRSVHTLLRNAVTSLQASAQGAFDARIASGEIDPGLGLIIAELRTAQHVDAAFNKLPDRHTDLYYQEIIGQTPAPASPEMVLLDLGRVPRPGFVPQGTALEALLPDGSVQRFETDTGVPVSPAVVSDVKVLSYQMDNHISYNRALGGITGLRAASLNTGTAHNAQTLFGSGTEQDPDIGLDISSPMLSLAEGTRRIEVSLHMSRDSNLPAGSYVFTEKEVKALEEKRKAEANPRRTQTGAMAAVADPDKAPKLRLTPQETDPEYRDPEVRLALSADPALISAFYGDRKDLKTADAIEELTLEVTEYASLHNMTTSLALIYAVLMDKVEKPAHLRLLLGRIVTLSLIEKHPFPEGDYWAKIYALVQKYRSELIGVEPEGIQTDSAARKSYEQQQNSMIFAAFSQRPDGKIDYPLRDVFQSLLGDAFSMTITTDDGPLRPDIMQVLPLKEKRAQGGIMLSMRYDASAPALTGPKDAPRLALRYATDARLCPVSFFEAYAIETISIRTQVTGLRKLAAFSDDGPLVTDQTFQPFGPRPSEGATFQVGCAEMARKPVKSINVCLEWSGMPNPVGGFETHYASYGRGVDIPDPKLTIDYLSGAGWKTVSADPVPLFQSAGASGTLQPEWEFSGKITGRSIPATGVVSAQEYQSRQTIRAGMIRFTLTGTAGGFLTDRYPMALVDAMRPRLVNLGERKIPPAPFVPEIASFSLSYTAEGMIELNAPETARAGEEVRQSGPFGSVSVFPKRMHKQIQLFPRRLGYGQVYFQLTGANTVGPTALTIDLASSGHLRRVPARNPLSWFYLSAHGWQQLPETAISSDTTVGLMRSGIVVIDLPDDATDHSTEMPAGGVWFAAVATEPNVDVFPSLSAAKVNGVWARRMDDTWQKDNAPRVWSFTPAQPGLTSIAEIPTPGTSRPPEPRDMFLARVGERLRHRRRGVTPWDMERLVLEEFPDVWMAKCLPHLHTQTRAPAPGHMTLVVARKQSEEAVLRNPQPALFDVTTLNTIQKWLADYTSDACSIDVVNPTFERLQVRAKLSANVKRENGAIAQLLRRDLRRFLSVWTADASMKRFGWSLNIQMLRAHIAEKDYIEKITDFSVLHLAGDDQKCFSLLDTAQTKSDWRGLYGPVLKPHFPWSLPISTVEHGLTIVPDFKDEQPTAAGIGSLTLGEMLIVGQRTVP
ncbi:hypothetical protein CEP88_10300 [Roseobacter denitrificans]|uniref:Baseplate protein J-like domain-containing protein n=1 Tax=Roseobacter denitrificans (strain ATCC 33942 / OCh 114) TaxID=375451 RepID=Q160D0_ROSDO|nr:hypothetical protein [Roseobacter denitrificans]ABG33663.1 hypothetical protein RD1_4226 [Roseobacter denitrificans OCh 114]AVL52953.1 hypothetical protein CEP88_10300 [Roseobacter denitrificans]SFG02990.1 hypothetical protein SAMN05443635_10614 [Roseobacter denitrificans OCh 114]